MEINSNGPKSATSLIETNFGVFLFISEQKPIDSGPIRINGMIFNRKLDVLPMWKLIPFYQVISTKSRKILELAKTVEFSQRECTNNVQ
jgi:hypothetical protein